MFQHFINKYIILIFMEEEIFKVYTILHPGFPGQYPPTIYEVSNQGNIKRNGNIFEPKLKNKYLRFSRFSVHRAVAELFIPNPNNYNEVDHINGDKLDNRAINLKWCSHKQNMNNPNTKQIGEKNGFYNHNHTEESRKQISESLKRYWERRRNQNKNISSN